MRKFIYSTFSILHLHKEGQVMILAVLALGGVILGATTIAGMLMAYQIRRATDLENSARAIFAADAGVECALYNNFKGGSCPPSFTLSNGTSYLYTMDSAPPPTPLVWWTFDDGAGSTVTDSSGSGNNGAWYGTGSHWVTTAKVGSYAGQFDGTNDFVLSPSLGAPPQSITLAAWIKPNAAGGVVFSELGQSAISVGWHGSQMEVEGDNTAKVCVWAGGEICVVAGLLTYGQWSHLVMVYDASSQKLTGYLNGTAGNSISAVKQYPPTLYYAVGATDSANGGNGSYFSGLIDDVHVYNAALSAEDVMNLYIGTAPLITVLSEGTAGPASRALQFSF